MAAGSSAPELFTSVIGEKHAHACTHNCIDLFDILREPKL